MSDPDRIHAVPGNGDAQLWRYVGLRIPLLVSRFLPFSVLLGTLIAFVGLNQHSEVVAMKAAGLGSATQIDEGGEGWDTGRELADAIGKAKSIDPNAVKNALQHQTLVTGGIQCYFWHRTPSDYSNITQIQSAVVTVGAGGTFNVLPHVGA